MKPTTLPRSLLVLSVAATLALAGPAAANTSHAGWPHVTGMLLMNKQDQDRPLDARPGSDPFDGTDSTYSCDGLHQSSACLPDGPAFAAAFEPDTTAVVPGDVGHNELLGGHGNDVIHAGPRGDVLWGDYKPSGQPTTQVDHLSGGPGNDFIYAGHGLNFISTGGGRDVIHAHFGHGVIHCDSKAVTVFLSRAGRHGYRLVGCRRISYRTLGY